MKKLVLVLLLVFVIGCAAPHEMAEEIPEEIPSEEIPVVQEEVPEEVPEEVSEYDAEVKALMDKSASVDNYQYDYSFSILQENKLYSIMRNYDVYIKGTRVKKSFTSPEKIGEGYYNDVYLADDAAWGVCSQAVLDCRETGEAKSLNYESQKLKMTPWSLTRGIPSSAKVVGKEKFDGRMAKIVEYYEDGKKIKLSVDEYSGLVLKKIVSLGDEVLETYYFRDLSVGNVKYSDVSWE